MGCEVKIFRPVLTVLFALNFIISSVYGEPKPKPKPKVPCYFIFGDSLADNGNNNLLDTRAKVNFPPYGIDFPQGPTGRFTNGRNIADFIAEFLGFDNYIPPFATGRGLEILQGLNYASGASGILDESGQHTGDRFSFNMQLQFHKTTILRIAALLGNRKSKDHLRKCIYTVGMGNNDYINNYFLPSFYESSHQFTPDQYAALLIKRYSQQLMTLYTYGARKVGVFGVGELGCIPSELNTYGTNGTACVEMIGNAVTLFNDRLIRLIEVLNNKLIDANFIYISPNSNKNSSEAGFKVANKPCCNIVSGLEDKGLCIIGLAPCTNRNEYEFWDAFHPTEPAMKILASTAFTALSPFYNYPTDIMGLPEDGDESLSSI